MRIKREDNSKNKAEKLARKGLIKQIVFVYGILFILIFILFLVLFLYTKLDFFTFVEIFGHAFVIPIIIYLISIPGAWFLVKPLHIEWAYEKIRKDHSKSIVEKNFISEVPIDIILINTRNGEYKDFILGLPYVEKTYAVLGKDNLISIYFKFKNVDEEKMFDVITKEEFTTYCEVVDENSKK